MWKPKEQRTLAPLSVPGASSAGSIRVVSGSGFRYVVPFPYRLHEMLSNVDEKFDSSIVSWLPDGKHFKVHDPRRFVECVIPSAFKQKSLKSFQRQLHLYGFQRVHEGVEKGAYYHEKFCRDDRDLCLSIARTKAPKRSRTTPTIRKNKTFSQKMPAFHSRQSNNTRAHNEGMNNRNLSTAPVSNIERPPITISPTIFDDVQSSLIPENNVSMKRPLHEATVSSVISLDGPSSSDVSSLTSQYKGTNNASFPQQLKSHLQLEGSIADTCRWLINAGVPVSAFDPVAIGDISHSTFAVPQIVSSTPFPPSITTPQQQSVTTETVTRNLYPSNTETTSVERNNEAEPLPFNNGIAASGEIHSLLSAVSQTHHLESLASTFQEGGSLFDNDPLLTDLLPGEHLPMVDDSLWAL